MQDPFYHKQKRPKKTRMLDADAWLDSAMYEFWQSLGRGYTRVQDFFSIFNVSGFRRFFVEIISDGLSFAAIGAVLMTALALPAFDATASGRFNKAEDISVIFLDRYGSEIGRRGIRSDDSVALDKLPDFLVKATLATEDRRFYEHFGIDVVGTLRALASNAQVELRIERGTGGGTIQALLMTAIVFSGAAGIVTLFGAQAWPTPMIVVAGLTLPVAMRSAEARGTLGVEAVGQALLHILVVVQVGLAATLLNLPPTILGALAALGFYAWGGAVEALGGEDSGRSVAVEFGALVLLGIIVGLLLYRPA